MFNYALYNKKTKKRLMCHILSYIRAIVRYIFIIKVKQKSIN